MVKITEKICPMCGGTFTQPEKGRTKKFCSSRCRNFYNMGDKTYLEKEFEDEKPKRKVHAGSSISEICREAKKAHMTYGQYVAVMNK